METLHTIVRSSLIGGLALLVAVGCERNDAHQNGADDPMRTAPGATDPTTGSGSLGSGTSTGTGTRTGASPTATGTSSGTTGSATGTGSAVNDTDRTGTGDIQRTGGRDEPMGTGGTRTGTGGHAGTSGSGGRAGSGGHGGSSGH
jgi:hypothetical protein